MQFKVKINRKNFAYDVYVTNMVKKKINEIFNDSGNPKNILAVIDANVFKYHHKKISSILKINKCKVEIIILHPSETVKSLSTVQKIYDVLIKNKFLKDTVIIAIGGGITGDVAGFAASTYMRGIRLIHIPTTVTAVVDSSIGGKTGVNHLKLKNVIGSFYHPEAVLIDFEFLETLSGNQIRAGFGEVIKYAFLSNQDFYNYILKNFNELIKLDRKKLYYVVNECIKIKVAVINNDETDSGPRKILNFGHTFAHAIESVSGYKISHGEAVVAGIVSALILSFQKGFVNNRRLTDYLRLPLKFKLSKKLLTINDNKVYEVMRIDKKNRDEQIRLVGLKKIGEILLDLKAGKQEILKAIRIMKNLVKV
ncbi:MAG TPA: 3-dehydroquinate synthase [Ignavibacteriaceae bacterium]